MSAEECIIKRKLFLKLESAAEDIVDFIDENPFDHSLTIIDIDCQINQIIQRRSEFDIKFLELKKHSNHEAIDVYSNIIQRFIDKYIKVAKEAKIEFNKRQRNVVLVIKEPEIDLVLHELNIIKTKLLGQVFIKKLSQVGDVKIAAWNKNITVTEALTNKSELPIDEVKMLLINSISKVKESINFSERCYPKADTFLIDKCKYKVLKHAKKKPQKNKDVLRQILSKINCYKNDVNRLFLFRIDTSFIASSKGNFHNQLFCYYIWKEKIPDTLLPVWHTNFKFKRKSHVKFLNLLLRSVK